MTSVLHRLYGDERDRAATPVVSLPRWLRSAFDNAAITEDRLAGAAIWVAVGVLIVVVAALTMGPVGGVAVFVALGASPAVLLFVWRGRRMRRIVDALPDTVEAFSRALRSGASFSQALRETAAAATPEVGAELQIVVGSIERGRTTTEALGDWVERAPVTEVRVVASVLALASENEAGTTQALDGVHHSLRDRAALEAEIRALTAQASSSMRAMVLLPVGFMLLDLASQQRTVEYLTTTTTGRFCLLAGVGLNVVGALWMRTLVRRRMAR